MDDIQSSFGPKPILPPTIPQPVIAPENKLFHQWFATRNQVEALKKFNDLIDIMLVKISEQIGRKAAVRAPQKDFILPALPDGFEEKIDSYFSTKWQKGQELKNHLLDLRDAIKKKDFEKALDILTKMTHSQLDSKVFNAPRALQQALNRALQPLLKEKLERTKTKADEAKAAKAEGAFEVSEGQEEKEVSKSMGAEPEVVEESADDHLLRIYFAEQGTHIAKKMGYSIAQVKNYFVEKLENQMLAPPDSETPFREAAEKFFTLLTSKEGQEMMVKLMSPDTASKEREKALALLKNAVKKGETSKTLEKGANDVEEASSPELFATAKEEEVNQQQGLLLLKDIVDPAMQAQLDALQKILDILKKTMPDDPRVKDFEDKFNVVLKHYKEGTLDIKDLANLEMQTNLLDLIGGGRLSPEDKITALMQLLGAVKSMQDVVGKGDVDLTNTLNKLQVQIDFYTQFKGDADALSELLAALQAGGGRWDSLTTEQYKKYANNYVNLMKNYDKMTPEEQKMVSEFSKKLDNLVPGGGFLKLLGSYYVLNLLPTSGPWTKEQFEAAMAKANKTLSDLIDQQKDNPLFQPFATYLKYMMPLNANTKGFNGAFLFAKLPDGSFGVNGNYGKSKYEFKLSGIDDALKYIQNLQQILNKKLADFKTQSDSVKSAIQQLADLKARLPDMQWAIDNLINKIKIYQDTLPDDFYNIIINKYMPMQEKRLMAFAMTLYFCNQGGMAMNSLLNNLTGWNLSTTTTDFNIGTGGAGKDVDDYKAKIQKELDNINQKMGQGDAAIKTIDDKIDAINKDPKYADRPEEKKKIIDQLNQSKNDIKAVQANMTALQTNLKSLQSSVTKLPLTDEQLKLVKTIGTQENLVVNGDPGDPKAVPPRPAVKGLNGIYGDINTNATNFTSQTENSQLMLQLTMTQMQQEWGLVTTCMQSLQQMYMTCARALGNR